MTDFVLQHGFGLSIAIAILGLATAVVLFLYIRTIPAGTDKMQEVASAIEEGAKAYLNRQVATISVIALLIGAAIWFSIPKHTTRTNSRSAFLWAPFARSGRDTRACAWR